MKGINGVPYKWKKCPACDRAFQYASDWKYPPNECGTCDPMHLDI